MEGEDELAGRGFFLGGASSSGAGFVLKMWWNLSESKQYSVSDYHVTLFHVKMYRTKKTGISGKNIVPIHLCAEIPVLKLPGLKIDQVIIT